MTKHRNHCDPVMLLRSVFFLVFYATCCCYSYDCNIGCALDVSVNGDIVCGSDNNVYPNECFAVCQVSSQSRYIDGFSIFLVELCKYIFTSYLIISVVY